MFRPWGRKAAVGGATLSIASLGAVTPANAVENGGNRDCNTGFTTLKVDRAPAVGDVYTDGTVTVTVTDVKYKADGSMEVYGFSIDITGASTFYVIVKGGPTNIRHNNGQTTDLDTRLGPGGRHYEISNVKFCYKV